MNMNSFDINKACAYCSQGESCAAGSVGAPAVRGGRRRQRCRRHRLTCHELDSQLHFVGFSQSADARLIQRLNLCRRLAGRRDFAACGQVPCLFQDKRAFMANRACCGTVVVGRCGVLTSGLAKSSIRKIPGRS